VHSAAADTLELPLADEAFDGALVGFGVRNLSDLGAGLGELVRVLKPGARLVVLDFATPRSTLVRALYLAYFRRVLPVVGRLVSGHPTAYSYLPESVMRFAEPEALARSLSEAGLHDVGCQRLTGGIAALTWGTR
jgi:demethylmenaquinone methyltransferase/2-methoxy-6-polyprenyl-1,4-benzoquinol methylase